MQKLRDLYAIWQQSRRRKGRVDDHPATDPGAEITKQQLAVLDAALPPAVNVVGNARSLLDQRHGTQIDAAPTIRFNRAEIADPAAQGNRWDFGVTSQERSLAHYKEHPPKFHTLIFTQYFDLHAPFLDGVDLGMPILPYPMQLSIELMDKLGARPTAGAQILFLLDRLGRRDVGIFGFDWKATLSVHHSERTRDPHNHLREMRLFRRTIARNGWTYYN